MMMDRLQFRRLTPVMLSFFVMGFVDSVGIASNYVKADLNLSDSQANLLPSLVFFWFFIFAIPSCAAMNRLGRKRTLMVSLVVTALSLAIPLFAGSYGALLAAFSLLGIGNTIMQISLNPLVGNIIAGDKLASMLTFGQFVKTIASFTAPYIAMWGAFNFIPDFGLGWRIMFPIYFVITILVTILLGVTSIPREVSPDDQGVFGALKLFGSPFVLLSFLGIVACVGIDVGLNITAPKLLIERAGMALSEAGLATSFYFVFRILGCFMGSILLQRIATKPLFLANILLMIVAVVILVFSSSTTMIFVAIAMIGFGDSNIFPMIFSQALIAEPNRGNQVSAIMVMGLIGGTIFPVAMGLMSDAIGQMGAILVIALGLLYLLCYSTLIRR